MDAGNRRPQLPALSYLDIDKVKREEEAYHNRLSSAPQTLPAVVTASPTYPYPPGPPPPYSRPAPPSSARLANAYHGPQAGVSILSESRRTDAEEQDAKQTTRQSLPSISEALGVDSQTSYSASTSAAPLLASAQASHPPFAAPSSPLAAIKRPYGMETPQAPQHAYSSHSTLPAFPHYQSEPQSQQPQSYASQDPPRSSYNSERPPLQVQTSQQARATQSSHTYAYSSSPHHEQPSSHSAGAMGPPSLPYGYTPYPPRYAQPTPPSSVTNGPIYQPSLAHPAPSTPSSTWKSEGSTRYGDDHSSAPTDYSSSVKRHLDLHDLEGAVNEIAQNSSIMLDFTRRYGEQLHSTARSGSSLSTLPGLVEVDDMVSKSRGQTESLLKIRDVVVAQQAAYEQQVADQRQQHKAFAEPLLSARDQESEAEDSKDGFNGADTKKRRGRAAPPGRCHSCHRAETPEWRRGPDGARTLCNACGLHYAKLTRKQQGANKAAPAGSSTLRPKDA